MMSLPSTDALSTGNWRSASIASLHEERHEAELDAVLRRERLLIALPQRHDGRHVDFVERRQHRGLLLRLQQALRDARAQPRHRDAVLVARTARSRRAPPTAAARPRRCSSTSCSMPTVVA